MAVDTFGTANPMNRRGPAHLATARSERALGDERQIGPGADAEIETPGRHRLMQLGAAREIEDLHVEPLLREEALLGAHDEWHHGGGTGRRLANPERVGGVRCPPG